MQDIQVNGGMTSGNSGGPVVSAVDGKLVGVAVSGFGGTAIAYAIPRNVVQRVLAGAAGSIRIAPRQANAVKEGPAEIRVSLVS